MYPCVLLPTVDTSRSASPTAAKAGQLDQLKRCLRDMGNPTTADVSCKDAQGRTPVTLAAEEGHTECLDELLRLRRPDYGENLLDSSRIGDMLSSPREHWEALVLAAAGGHHPCVKLLLEHGTLPDSSDVARYNDQLSVDGLPDGSPLLQAAKKGHTPCVRALLTMLLLGLFFVT